MINIIGFDPSLRNWGIAAAKYDPKTDQLDVFHFDVIQPKLSNDKQVRVNSRDVESAMQLFQKAKAVMQGSHIVCIEVPHGSQSARAMASYGICIGVIGALKALDIPVIEVSALDVKKVLGKKDASKAEVIAFVQAKHPNAPYPMHLNQINQSKAEHCCDAVVAIYAAMQTELFKVLRTAHLKG